MRKNKSILEKNILKNSHTRATNSPLTCWEEVKELPVALNVTGWDAGTLCGTLRVGFFRGSEKFPLEERDELKNPTSVSQWYNIIFTGRIYLGMH